MIIKFFDNNKKLIEEYDNKFPYIVPRVGENIHIKTKQKDFKVATINHYLPSSNKESKYIVEVLLQ